MKIRFYQRGGGKYHGILEFWARKFLEESCSTRLRNTLNIRIELRSSKLRKGVRGNASLECMENSKKKQFTVLVNRDMSPMSQVSTMIHELQHVLQFAQRRLGHKTVRKESGFFWVMNGKRKFFPHATTEYWTSPWEVEAREVQGAWERRFSSHFNESCVISMSHYEAMCASLCE